MKLALLLGASIFAHAAAFAAFGHGSSRSTANSAVQTLEIDAPEIVSVPDAPIPEPIPTAPVINEVAQTAHPLPTHTHDYPVPADHDATPHDPNLVHLPIAMGDHDHDHHDDHADEATPVAVAQSSAPHFSMVLGGSTSSSGSASTGSTSKGTGSAINAHDDEGFAGPLPESAVDERAKLLASTSPQYPSAAAEEQIEADVTVEIVVDAEGRVTDAHSLSHKGYGLDEAAARGVRAYRFSPAKRGGRPVAVRMKWVVQFRLS